MSAQQFLQYGRWSLYQLRNIINRRNATASPSANVTVSEEFFLLVTEVHILTAALAVFKMNSLNDRPNIPEFQFRCEKQSSSECRTIYTASHY